MLPLIFLIRSRTEGHLDVLDRYLFEVPLVLCEKLEEAAWKAT